MIEMNKKTVHVLTYTYDIPTFLGRDIRLVSIIKSAINDIEPDEKEWQRVLNYFSHTFLSEILEEKDYSNGVISQRLEMKVDKFEEKGGK